MPFRCEAIGSLVSEEVASRQGPLQLLAELERIGVVTETSLTLPPDTPFDQCDALAGMLGQLHGMGPWLLGDLLNHMEKVYGETYAQASATTGLAEQTLSNYCSTCSRIPRSRRRPWYKISYSVHAELAWLPPKEQEDWLRRIGREGMTRERVREELAPLRAAKRLERQREKGLLDPVPVSAVPDRVGNGLAVPDRQTTDLVRHSGIPEHVPIITVDGVEVLPPTLSNGGRICQCVRCGRYHRDDVDVGQ